MAVIQDKVVLDLAKKIIDGSGELINAVNKIDEAFQWGIDAGINFVDFANLIVENGETQHTEPEFLNEAAAIVVPALITWLATQTVNGNNYREVLQHNRKNQQ